MGKLYSVCSTSALSERNCAMVPSPLGGTQQIGALEIAAKSVTPSFALG